MRRDGLRGAALEARVRAGEERDEADRYCEHDGDERHGRDNRDAGERAELVQRQQHKAGEKRSNGLAQRGAVEDALQALRQHEEESAEGEQDLCVDDHTDHNPSRRAEDCAA